MGVATPHYYGEQYIREILDPLGSLFHLCMDLVISFTGAHKSLWELTNPALHCVH